MRIHGVGLNVARLHGDFEDYISAVAYGRSTLLHKAVAPAVNDYILKSTFLYKGDGIGQIMRYHTS
jgi:hypothetical protein